MALSAAGLWPDGNEWRRLEREASTVRFVSLGDAAARHHQTDCYNRVGLKFSAFVSARILKTSVK
jgi:hypothetical protein